MFIEVTIAGIMFDPKANIPVVILKDKDESFAVPIWIGLLEASAIALKLEKVDVPRPLTHDLLINMLKSMDAEVTRVEVTELRDNTFFALVHVTQGDELLVLDSRPSDALALALRTGAPIFVDEGVVKKARIPTEDGAGPEFNEENREKWKKMLEEMDSESFGKYKM